MEEKVLPFPRGKFFTDGIFTPAAEDYPALEGYIARTRDTVHGTNRPMELICLRNGSGSDITIAHKLYKFGTGAKEFTRVIGGVNDVAGGLALPIDDSYVAGQVWKANDLAWFVLNGPCYTLSETGTMNLATHDAVVSDGSGYIDGDAAAAGETVLGVIDQASTDENTDVLIWYEIHLKPEQPA